MDNTVLEQHPDYNSPSALKLFLDSHDMAMQKKFGQNFLVNGDARKLLVKTLDLTEKTKVWEIGPGLGAMTDAILQQGADLTVFEIDRGFASLISQFFADYEKKDSFRIVQGDVLKTWKKTLQEQGTPDCFFGNLPYNISSVLIGATIEAGVRFNKMLVTVQKEVAQRMTAQPGSKDYSSFSVLCQWSYEIKSVITLAGGNFWPRPNVDSRAVLMVPRSDFPRCKNPKLFMKMQRSLFSARRKTIKNNLSTFCNDSDKAQKILTKSGIDAQIRAETLQIEELLALSDAASDELLSENVL